jgi:TfoX/Sxy family transcriptional regulator of competence genes
MAKAMCKVPAATLALYDTLLATNPCVKRKGAASAYTSLNGHMFSFMTEAGTLALRLPTDAREAFLKKYSTKLCVQYGTVMKEYVEVPAALLRKTQVLQTFFEISYTHVASLEPTPTTRKKTAKKTATGKKATGRKTAARKKTE